VSWVISHSGRRLELAPSSFITAAVPTSAVQEKFPILDFFHDESHGFVMPRDIHILDFGVSAVAENMRCRVSVVAQGAMAYSSIHYSISTSNITCSSVVQSVPKRTVPSRTKYARSKSPPNLICSLRAKLFGKRRLCQRLCKMPVK
jgi:hypothetical protein